MHLYRSSSHLSWHSGDSVRSVSWQIPLLYPYRKTSVRRSAPWPTKSVSQVHFQKISHTLSLPASCKHSSRMKAGFPDSSCPVSLKDRYSAAVFHLPFRDKLQSSHPSLSHLHILFPVHSLNIQPQVPAPLPADPLPISQYPHLYTGHSPSLLWSALLLPSVNTGGNMFRTGPHWYLRSPDPLRIFQTPAWYLSEASVPFLL